MSGRALLLTAACAASLALAGCGGGVTAGQATVNGTPAAAGSAIDPAGIQTEPGAAAASACAPGRPGQTGTLQRTVTVAPPGSFNPAGDQRTYTLWVPATYDPTKGAPLIVNYHGTSGTPAGIDAFSSNLSQKANARGYIVAAPQAITGGKAAVAWSVPGFGTTPDDVAFTRAMLDQIGSEYCVDPKRMYATGFSSGGAMSTYIACSAPDRFAAVVPGGGVNLIDPSCQSAPIPLYAYHGTADDIAFYNGIDGQPSQPNPATAGTVPFFGSVEQVVDVWAAGNGCQPQRTDTPLAADAVLRTYSGCGADTRVLLALGGGHTFPGGTTRLDESTAAALGPTIASVNMADLMLDWFDTQKKA